MSDSAKTDLRPCSFCGGMPFVEKNMNGDRIAIRCQACRRRTDFWVEPNRAMEAWNTGEDVE